MHTEFQIIKNRPMPPPRGGKATDCRYPWASLGVGDCFEVPADLHGTVQRTQTSMSAQASARSRKDGRKYATRCTGETVTVWRTA